MLKIEIVGTEDSKQQDLVKRVKKALEELALSAQIAEVTQWEKIVSFNIIKTPALVVRKHILSQGIVPEIDELKQLFSAFIPDNNVIAL